MKKKSFLILLMMFFVFVPKEAQASEFMFESLKAFGKLNGYLAGFILILQCLIVYTLAINIILKALEMLSNPDMTNLVTTFLGHIMVMILVIHLPRMVINAIKGITFNGVSVGSGYTSAEPFKNELMSTSGFQFISNFITTINIITIIIFGVLATVTFLLSTMNYLANNDLSSYVRHIVVSILFVSVALAFNGFSIRKARTSLDGKEVDIVSIKEKGDNNLLELSNINFNKAISFNKAYSN